MSQLRAPWRLATDPDSGQPPVGAGAHAASRRPSLASRTGLGLAAVAVAVALVAQVVIAVDRVTVTGFLGAAEAQAEARLHATLAFIGLACAWALPAEWRRYALVPFAVIPLGVLVVTGLNGVAWSATATVLLVAAMHGAGVAIGRLLRLGRLSILITTAAGFATVGVLVQLLGRVGLLKWWTIGLPLMLAGAAVLADAARRQGPSLRRAWSGLHLDATEATVACLLLLQLGWALVYAAAPEIQYDALSAKAALPATWAESGRIETPLTQPGFAVLGSAQNVATVGWLVGAEAVGRYLQLVLATVVIIALLARARAVGRVAWCVALALAVMPHYTWQASTAYDDDILLFVCAAAAAAVLALAGADVPQRGAAVLVGLLTGSVVSAKLHLVVFGAVLALGWLLVQKAPWREWLARFGLLTVGGLAVAGPVPLFRYLDTGNPLFPFFNGIFKSPYLAPVTDTANFPYTDSAGLRALLQLPYDITAAPFRLVEAQPPGAFGFLLVLIVLGLGVAGRRGRGGVVVGLAVVAALVAWWVQLRYLRYLLPYAGVGAVLLTWGRVPGPPRLARPRADLATAAAAAALSAACFVSLLASFWNIPERVPTDVVLGRESAYDYQAPKIPGFVVLQDLNRAAGRGDVVVSHLYARAVLRPDLDIESLNGLNSRLDRQGVKLDTVPALLSAYEQEGVRWAALSTEQRVALDPASVFTQLLSAHGTLVSAAGGTELYALGLAVQEPERQPLCDPSFAGGIGPGTGPTCWGVALDAAPGLTPAEATNGSVTQQVPVCPGASYAVDVDVDVPGAQVVLTFSQAEDLRGAIQRYSATAAVAAGSTRAYATAPSRGRTMFIQIVPNGATVRSAQLTRVGGPDC